MKRFLLFICTCLIFAGAATAQEQVLNQEEVPDSVNDKRLMGPFNSEMAAINWMSRNGWDLYMHSPHINDGDSAVSYIMRMDVTGMTEEQINSKLTMFVIPTADVLPPQNFDGSFPTTKPSEE